jgi:hypothetical protein
LQKPLPNLAIVPTFLARIKGQRAALFPRTLRGGIYRLQPAIDRLIARGPMQQFQELAEIGTHIHDDFRVLQDAPDRPRQSSCVTGLCDPSSALAINREAQAGTKNRQRFILVPLTGKIDVLKRGAIQPAAQA